MNFLEISNRSFSPRDYQTEILSQAYERNIITCLQSSQAKEFCALKLIQELSYELRRKNDKKISLYITNSLSAYNLLYYLTDLNVKSLTEEKDFDWTEIQKNYQVIFLESEQCLSILDSSLLDLNSVNILIVDDCHYRTFKKDLSTIFRHHYKNAEHKPKVFGLAGAVHSASCSPGRLGAELEYLEEIFNARAETASDVVTVLRYSPRPIEIIVECSSPPQNEPALYIRKLIQNCKSFIKDHRYDPSEIYAEEYKDELDNMPDPKTEPLKCIDEFLLILDELGVYGADKAAYLLIIQIEKLKINTPYERHYLLLCCLFTTLVQIRSFCDVIFNKESFENEMEKITAFSSPKLLRLIEVLEIFKQEKKNKKNLHGALKEVLFDVNLEEINTMVVSTGERIAKIGDDLEKLKKNVRKINGENDSVPIVKQSRHYRKYRKKNFNHRIRGHLNQGDSEVLCGLIFCESIITAKTLFCLLCEVSRHHPNLSFLNTQYTVSKTISSIVNSKEAELEHRKQEEVLKKFRMHECNLLITMSVLEEGYDLPKCNLVVRFDQPQNYRSYVQCKARAKAAAALHVIMVSPKVLNVNMSDNHQFVCELLRNNEEEENDEDDDKSENDESENNLEINQSTIHCHPNECNERSESTDTQLYEKIEDCSEIMINKLAEYMEIEKTLIKKCANKEPDMIELVHADQFSKFLIPYQPSEGAQVSLSTAISLLNKYCSKLPSDTFTKLTPIWRCCKVIRNSNVLYQYTLRLPLNCPLKHDVFGAPMITRTLARRVAALTTCKILHKIGELDGNLQPIGKEGFKAIEEDWQFFELDKTDEELSWNDQDDPRPGTTKRRQYYYKRIASSFTNCRPTESSKKVYLYHIAMTLQCPIPDEQNTRGRKIYSPEDALQSFGILTTKKIPKISAFPIFTRSGETKVRLVLKRTDLVLNKEQIEKINIFISYTFTSVLRLRKYLMLFDPEANENSFFVVPVKRESTGHSNDFDINVDWDFLETIKQHATTTPTLTYINDDARKTQPFDFNRFKDSVVMPWYRNQDQPQYFYVAEICNHLTPESSFPGDNYSTFAEYYHKKYGIEIQNKKQPLLDVDHTSARLNFLTPRYVNRKGVALPTSSEETKKAKRENLEQKQILVPELCTVHPFTASLWRAAVCLPCILYRINALLLADEIRMEVSTDLGLGTLEVLDEEFEWPCLNFGWTLADVLKKAREDKLKLTQENEVEEKTEKEEEEEDKGATVEKSANDLLEEATKKSKADELEIGTWSNEMADDIDDDFDEDDLGILPKNLEMCSTGNSRYRYVASPTSWDEKLPKQSKNNFQDNFLSSDEDDDDDFQSDEDYESNGDQNENEGDDDEYGLTIEFKNDHLAEAFESEEKIKQRQKNLNLLIENRKEEILEGFNLIEEQLNDNIKIHEEEFENCLLQSKKVIMESGCVIKYNKTISTDIRQTLKIDYEIDENVNISLMAPYMKGDLEEKQIELDKLYELNAEYQNSHPDEEFEVVGCGDSFDHFSDFQTSRFDNNKKFIKVVINNDIEKFYKARESSDKFLDYVSSEKTFGFDYQPDLYNHPGPSPSIILQALTMSNANDGINLERLETIGDSFLKYAITTYLYCTYENVNEGKLSYLRSKQVSNLNLYRLGKKKILGESMIASKFEPQDNYLPPMHFIPKELEQALIDAKIPLCYWNLAEIFDVKKLSSQEICDLVKERAKKLDLDDSLDDDEVVPQILAVSANDSKEESHSCYIPYNLVTQHSIPDKSIADCVEALIGAYLIDCGPRGGLLFMAWLGIRVLPIIKVNTLENRIPGSTREFVENGETKQIIYGFWKAPRSPLIRCIPDADKTLEILLDGFDKFEEDLNYKFKDRSYLLQAMTHASYTPNRLTDCYQRLEFLGDAVLDYLITRHLYDDVRLHSPGALTDLRSALVNNTIFASLAVRHGFHKYFRHLSPALNEVIDKFVRIQIENNHCISEEYYLLSEDECNESEDVEVPKALGDVFESIAGAIFLDSNMSLDAVWKVYYRMMEPEIEQFSKCVPKSPIRELLELEPETAKFGKPEKLADGRRVRVTVEVFGKGIFRGIGRNYRIAKCTAAKCALRQLKKNVNKKSHND